MQVLEEVLFEELAMSGIDVRRELYILKRSIERWSIRAISETLNMALLLGREYCEENVLTCTFDLKKGKILRTFDRECFGGCRKPVEEGYLVLFTDMFHHENYVTSAKTDYKHGLGYGKFRENALGGYLGYCCSDTEIAELDRRYAGQRELYEPEIYRGLPMFLCRECYEELSALVESPLLSRIAQAEEQELEEQDRLLEISEWWFSQQRVVRRFGSAVWRLTQIQRTLTARLMRIDRDGDDGLEEKIGQIQTWAQTELEEVYVSWKKQRKIEIMNRFAYNVSRDHGILQKMVRDTETDDWVCGDFGSATELGIGAWRWSL